MKIRRWHITLLLVLLGHAFSQAQSTSDWFPILLPADDGFIPEDQTNWFFPSTPIDPAGTHGFLTVDSEGHFRFEDGTPVRFVGVNLVAGAALPDSAAAKIMARRLAKFGVNIVRLFHLDNSSSNRQETLITPGPDSRHLSSEQLARLDYFIHQLALHGIYVCLPLHSARRFQPGDGVARADSLPLYAKAVSLFEPKLIELQKEHAANLLSRQNPYTGLRYAEDPQIAMLEISNENSLYAAWKQDLLNGRRVYNSGLSYFHQQMLDSLWHDFLRDKYGATDSLRQAWQEGVFGREGENLLRNGDFENALGNEWILEQHGNASASLDRVSSTESGYYAGRVSLQKTTDVIWDVQLKQVGMPIAQDSSYTLSFLVQAKPPPLPRQIRVALVRDDQPSVNLGLDVAILLQSNLWQAYAMNFVAAQSNEQNARLTFAVSGRTGEIRFDRVQLQHTHTRGLLSTESLEARNIKRIEHRERLRYSAARVHDTAEFYERRAREFYSEMYRHLKEKTGAKMLITASNIYGGPAEAKSFAITDYIDHHAYWDHPQYPRQLFSKTDWYILNLPMLRQPWLPGGTIAILASKAVAGKPFSVSEYNHPFPNQYQAEALPLLAVYGSLQDWDALFIYSYHEGFGNWLPQAMSDNSQIDANPVMMAMLPQLAQLFRNRLIQRAHREVRLEYTSAEIYRYDAERNGWLGVEGHLPEALALVHRLRIGSFEAPVQRRAADYGVGPLVSPYHSDTGEIEWDDQIGVLKVETPQLVVISGFLNDQPIFLNKVNVLSASGFGTVLWTATSVAPLESTEKSLLTIVNRTENSSQQWNIDRTTLNNWGSAPVRMEPQRLFLEFHLPVDSLWIYPLDELGRASIYRSLKPDAHGFLRIYLDQRATPSVWYGLRHFNKPVAVRQPEDFPSKVFALRQSYPNPAYDTDDGLVQIRYSLPQAADVTLILYDLGGRQVRHLVQEHQNAGGYLAAFSVAGLPSGVYFYRLQAGTHHAVGKMLVMGAKKTPARSTGRR